MTYKATLKVQFDTEWTSTHYSSGFDDMMLPEEHYTFEIPAEDLNTYQLFNFFATVARAMGHDDLNIMKGACGLAFGEHRKEEDMRKVAEEYDLKLQEDLSVDEKWNEQNKVEPNHWEHRYWELRSSTGRQITDLKAKLSRALNPDNPQYTDEEMDAMCDSAEKEELRKKLEKASVVCFDCGKKYGEYHNGVSSVWEGKCNVCGETKSITESRDFNYLMKGIRELGG